MKTNRIYSCVVGISILMMSLKASAHIEHISVRPLATNIIIPQSRVHAVTIDHRRDIEITAVDVKIDILESTATTTIEIKLINNTNNRQEAELIVPVPDKAVVKGFAYDGPSGQITAEVLLKDQARKITRL